MLRPLSMQSSYNVTGDVHLGQKKPHLQLAERWRLPPHGALHSPQGATSHHTVSQGDVLHARDSAGLTRSEQLVPLSSVMSVLLPVGFRHVTVRTDVPPPHVLLQVFQGPVMYVAVEQAAPLQICTLSGMRPGHRELATTSLRSPMV